MHNYTHPYTYPGLEKIPVWKDEKRFKAFPHFGTPSLWFFLEQPVRTGESLPIHKQNISEYGFQWQTPLWIKLLFQQNADLLILKYFLKRVLTQQIQPKHRQPFEGIWPVRHISIPNLGEFLPACWESCLVLQFKDNLWAKTRLT